MQITKQEKTNKQKHNKVQTRNDEDSGTKGQKHRKMGKGDAGTQGQNRTDEQTERAKGRQGLEYTRSD